MSDARWDALMEQVEANIERVGWHCMGIFPREGDDQTWPFSYTIGLADAGHAELLLAGLPIELAHRVLARACSLVIEHKEQLSGRRDDVLDDQPVWFLPMGFGDVGDHFGVALLRMRNGRGGWVGKIPTAVQLVWPDKQGRFPWQGGEFAYGQPVLAPMPT